jgi:hypothetical protein
VGRAVKHKQARKQARAARHWAAYHEAAHAVTALLVGQQIAAVELIGEGEGLITYHSPAWYEQLVAQGTRPPRASLSAEQRRYIAGRLLIGLAAVRMEQTLRAVHPVQVPNGEWDGDDWHQVSILARTLTDGDQAAAQALVDRAWQHVGPLLADNMAAVGALAKRLGQAGRLSGDEVAQLLLPGRAHAPLGEVP